MGFLSPITDLFGALAGMAKAVVSIIKLLGILIMWLPKLINIVINLLNPVVFIKDILNGVFKGITLILEAAIDIVFNTPREKGDKVDIGKNGIFPGGIFGTNNYW